MPRLLDDPRYAAALAATEAVQARELGDFRRRLANRIVAMTAEAVEQMGETFDEDLLAKALAKVDEAYVEESMAYVRRVLLAAGEIEIAKKLDEMQEAIGLDELPPVLRSAYEEMQRAGKLPSQGRPSPAGLTAEA